MAHQFGFAVKCDVSTGTQQNSFGFGQKQFVATTNGVNSTSLVTYELYPAFNANTLHFESSFLLYEKGKEKIYEGMGISFEVIIN